MRSAGSVLLLYGAMIVVSSTGLLTALTHGQWIYAVINAVLVLFFARLTATERSKRRPQ
ncbi:hypothetical protein ACIBI4_27635 [Streptomyces sp. NPDC050418]|uniref:hypothetical protein n=1 Tax=Streptomyces sp. NPDC050418 TaxID=3365612 RepID=UPI003794BB40